jgi:hypothetical protein
VFVCFTHLFIPTGYLVQGRLKFAAMSQMRGLPVYAVKGDNFMVATEYASDRSAAFEQFRQRPSDAERLRQRRLSAILREEAPA